MSNLIERLRDPAFPPKPAGDMVLRLSAAEAIERAAYYIDRLERSLRGLAVRDMEEAQSSWNAAIANRNED